MVEIIELVALGLISGVVVGAAPHVIARATGIIDKEKKKWNNGKCPQCNSNWNYRQFYRSGGNKAVALECYSCHKHIELDFFDPYNN